MTSPFWNGLPPKPERAGWHWIGPRAAPFPAEWLPATRTWVWAYGRWVFSSKREGVEVARVVAEDPNVWVYHRRCPAPRKTIRSVPKQQGTNA